jgi:hypothetical protein
MCEILSKQFAGQALRMAVELVSGHVVPWKR